MNKLEPNAYNPITNNAAKIGSILFFPSIDHINHIITIALKMSLCSPSSIDICDIKFELKCSFNASIAFEP